MTWKHPGGDTAQKNTKHMAILLTQADLWHLTFKGPITNFKENQNKLQTIYIHSCSVFFSVAIVYINLKWKLTPWAVIWIATLSHFKLVHQKQLSSGLLSPRWIYHSKAIPRFLAHSCLYSTYPVKEMAAVLRHSYGSSAKALLIALWLFLIALVQRHQSCVAKTGHVRT